MIKKAFPDNLSPADKQNLIKYLTGGLAIGSAAGLATSLGQYLRRMKERSMEQTAGDDDILYLNLPGKTASASAETPEVPKDSLLTPGFAISGGLLAATGGYVAVQKLYNMLRRKQLQKELDKSQQSYITALQDKHASQDGGRGLTKGENLLGLSQAALILTALGGGVLTNTLLNQAYPRPKPPTRTAPRKVVFRRNGALAEEEDEELQKAASITDTDAKEFLACVVLALPGLEKVSSVPDLVCAVADGRFKEIEGNVQRLGWDSALTLVKGASRKLGELEKVCSVRLCLENPITAPGFELLIASEMAEASPTHVKQAAALGADTQQDLVDIMAQLQVGHRNDLADQYERPDTEEDTVETVPDEQMESTLLKALPIDLEEASDNHNDVEKVDHVQESVASDEAE